jgi:hypothetical protein
MELPFPREQLIEAIGRMIGDASDDADRGERRVEYSLVMLKHSSERQTHPAISNPAV